MLILSEKKKSQKFSFRQLLFCTVKGKEALVELKKKYRARKEHNRSPLDFIYMHKLIVS